MRETCFQRNEGRGNFDSRIANPEHFGIMKLPPDVQFHDDIRLLVWRPRGLVDEAAMDETKVQLH